VEPRNRATAPLSLPQSMFLRDRLAVSVFKKKTTLKLGGGDWVPSKSETS